jgi:DNA-binding transcriptional LysR family regulator
MQTQLRDVEYFAAIAEHGQVQRAAEALGLSQPALSKSLRRLEQSMKTKLLKRTPKGVELTSVGSALLARVRKLRLSLDDVTREIADLSEGRAGHLRIGTAAGPALHLVPTACAALLKEAPKVTLKITASDTNAMLTGLRNGELDIAVTLIQGPRHEDLVEEHTHDDIFVIYASANHRLAKRKQLTLADLVQERWAVAAVNSPSERVLSQALGNSGLPPPNIAIETTAVPIRHHLVAATDLLALGTVPTVRYAAARFGIVELRVKDFAATRRGGVFYRKDAYLSPAAKRFIEILKATAKEIAAENR